LRAYGIEVPGEPKLPDGSTPMPTRVSRTRRVREELGVGHQLSLLPTMAGSWLFRDFIALHMTWGAINELTTLSGYHQLIRRSEHPVLHQMLRRVIQDERRHFAFYRAQGKARLAAAPRRTRKVVRWSAPPHAGLGRRRPGTPARRAAGRRRHRGLVVGSVRGRIASAPWEPSRRAPTSTSPPTRSSLTWTTSASIRSGSRRSRAAG